MKVNTIAEIVPRPHIKGRSYFQEMDFVPGIEGKVSLPLSSFKLSRTPAHVDSPPPVIDQHTDEMLGALGYGAEDISRLRAAGIV